MALKWDALLFIWGAQLPPAGTSMSVSFLSRFKPYGSIGLRKTSSHFSDNWQFGRYGREMAGKGRSKYYEIAKIPISQEPLIVQGLLIPQNVGKNLVFRVSVTNRGTIYMWVFIMINFCCRTGCKKSHFSRQIYLKRLKITNFGQISHNTVTHTPSIH